MIAYTCDYYMYIVQMNVQWYTHIHILLAMFKNIIHNKKF